MAGIKIIVKNRKAFHTYFVEETFEAGMELLGSEVKSCRANNVAMSDAYARILDGEVFLIGLNIAGYKQASYMDHDPIRKRKLLLHKREIKKLKVAIEAKRFTLVPLKLYFKNGKVKVELGLCKGKNVADKRQTMREKTDKMAAKRAIAQMR